MVREGFKLSRPTRATLYLLAGGVSLYVAAVAVMRTAWFHRFLLGRVTSSLESLTGARVEVQWNGHRQAQEVVAASGFAAQNQRVLHFGLGSSTTID